MANTLFFSPATPHFFQPLLSRSQSYLNIPVKFFSEYIEGKHEGKTVTLKSDGPEKSWKVKMEGQRLTEGWKEFVKAYDLRVGDFVIFRHERDMLFHVTALGPCCCEIQYAPSGSRVDENERSLRSMEQVEENLTAKSNQSSSDLNCFTQSVTASNISRDTVGVPSAFAKRNGLKGSQEIVLMNEEGISWPSELKGLIEFSRIVIVRGWTSFCTANKLEVGDSCTFKLIQNAKTPVFRLCSRTKAVRKKETLSAEDNIAEKTVENRFVKLTPTSISLEIGKQHLPASFTRVNGLIKPGKIILVDKNGTEWSMELKVEKISGYMYMYIMSRNGWRIFCAVNEVRAGESLTLELIRGGANPMLKFCSKMETPPFEAEARAHKRARVQKWSQETRPKLEIRETTVEEGEPSHRTRASNKTNANLENLQDKQPCYFSDQMIKVKHSVGGTLTRIRRFRKELERMEQELEDSLQDINNLVSSGSMGGTERRRQKGIKQQTSSSNQV